MMRKVIFGILFFVLFSVVVNAQLSDEYSKYKNKYPNAQLVRLLSERVINIGIEEGEIVITQETTKEDLYLDESAIYHSKQSLDFSSFYELEDVKASSFIYENGSYRKIDVKDFREKDELNGSFYDDIKSLNFVFSNLKLGAKSRLAYKEKIKNPRFLNSFYFGSSYPLINSKVTFIVDKNVTLEFKEFNIEGLKIDFIKQEKRKNVIYSWESKDINKLDIEDNSPNFRNTFPHIIPIITEYEVNGEKIKLSKEVSDLYNWYYSLVKDLNKDETNGELKSVVEELIKDKDSEFEKVRAIYYWVQKNIKYIAFEYALGGFIPREANDVYMKKFGDCKDNSSILFEMFKIANIKGNLTWIGTRSIPYKYAEVPTPVVDNHMILSYNNNGQTYFLDATGRYIPLELPTSFIQGKEALVSKGPGSFELIEVPIVAPEKNSFIDSIQIKLKGENLIGIGRVEISGYQKIDYYNILESKNTEDKLKEYYAIMFRKGNNKFLIDSISEKNKFEYDENFIVNYSFNINGYVQESGNEVYVNLNLNRKLSSYKTKKDRKSDIEYDYKKANKYITVLDIPDNLKVTYLPGNIEVSNELFSGSVTYSLMDNQIIYKHDITLNFLTLDLNQQKEFNEFIKKIEKQYKEVVVLEKK